MKIQWQTFLLAFFILASVSLSATFFSRSSRGNNREAALHISAPGKIQQAALVESAPSFGHSPVRKWDVLDPSVKTRAVLIQSLDDHFPFFHYNTYEPWPLASLSKLITAVVVIEAIGEDAKVAVSETAVATEGEAGGFRPGEVYRARDLLKIMLLASSNDAATAFEEHLGGRAEFVKRLNRKAGELMMLKTILHDSSGLSDLNQATANDLARLTRYILETHPEIFAWSRLESFLVQPENASTTKTIFNINPFAKRQSFLGGKTGTSEEARENLIAIFSFGKYRILMVLLGSSNRITEADKLLTWVGDAYQF